MISLYDDQMELVNKTRAAAVNSKAVLIQSATGSGKTRIAQYMIESGLSRGNGSIFIVPRKQLLLQTSETFSEAGIEHSFISPDHPYNPYAPVLIGMTETMGIRALKGTLPKRPFLFMDEVHHGNKAINNIINYYPDSWKFGLSATPIKMNGKPMGDWFDTMVCGKSIRWLIDNKRLADYRYMMGRVPIDLSGIKKIGGEYNGRQIDEYMQDHEKAIIGDVIGAYKKHCMGNLHLVRCVNIARSQAMAFAFNQAGIPAAHVDGNTKKVDLDRILHAYARREILVLCFCDLLTFGFDLAQYVGMKVNVESGSDTKPSLSLASQMQWWGRMLRYNNGKLAVFIDHVNNWKEHGYPDDERLWSLDGNSKKYNGERAIPTRQCPECGEVHKPSPLCPDCGYVYQVKDRVIEEIKGDIVEVSREERARIKAELELKKKQARKDQGMARTFPELVKLGKERGYKNPAIWAKKIMRSR